MEGLAEYESHGDEEASYDRKARIHTLNHGDGMELLLRERILQHAHDDFV